MLPWGADLTRSGRTADQVITNPLTSLSLENSKDGVVQLDAMRLSAEQFRHIAGSLGVKDAAVAGSGRRSAARSESGRPATIIPCGGQADRRPFAVIMLNISASGLAIKDPPPLKRGDQFVLRVPATETQSLSAILCTVVYFRLMADGSEVAGAQFSRVLDVTAPQPTDPYSPSPEDQEHVRRLEARLMAARHGSRET